MPPRYRNDERDPAGAAESHRADRPGPSVCDSCRRPLTRWTTAVGGTRCTGCAPAAADPTDREPVTLGEALAGAFAEVARSVPAAPLLPAQRTGPAAAEAHAEAGLDPGAEAGATCRRCGARAVWHLTVRGRWILMEPGEWPTGAVPVGKRWRITADGIAVNLGASGRTDTCRISHFDTCSEEPAPYESSVMLGLWHQHAR
ncbi:DUF6083 domain-containing protein [Kitasatospora sp. NBC_00240]|uniref:DUF6083 domain-containing protein n=1 Tax=Kitasatospora sp. NBC_00240 TaxID=2903567 RepID=UPI0022552F90|nr:DUF6083 domain-containing protein [Kitasatospora sp. NBC_00240]MCX5211615.1 DUF6083 domain-containing protein [Kitasatospora sp. NBC_00240]